jgi:metal-dependent amidase/aminoacylase/carboxypeptidase family protein
MTAAIPTIPKTSDIATEHRPNLSKYEDLYKHFRANPELSNQEKDTAARCVSELKSIASGFDIEETLSWLTIFYSTPKPPKATVWFSVEKGGMIRFVRWDAS